MIAILCGVTCILVAAIIGWKVLNKGDTDTNFGFSEVIIGTTLAVGFALFVGFLIGTKISDNVNGVVEFKAEDYYLDYRINLTQVNGKIVGRDTTYVLTRKD